jgi:hypothetical protein
MTYSNVNIWFNLLREFFVSFGFAELRENGIEALGELAFREGQEDRITSKDESGIVLDNVEKSRGGRPVMSFDDSKLQDAPDSASHKNSYHASGMFAVTQVKKLWRPILCYPRKQVKRIR